RYVQIHFGLLWLFFRHPGNDAPAVRCQVEKTAYTACSLAKIKGTSRDRPNLFVGPQPRLRIMEGIAFDGVVHPHDAAFGRLVQKWARRAPPARVRPARV